MKRIFELVLTAVVSSLVTWALGHWSETSVAGERAWQRATSFLGRLEVFAWWAVACSVLLALIAVGVRWRRSWEPGVLEEDLYLPSPVTIFAGSTVLLSLAALGMRLSGRGSALGVGIVVLVFLIALRAAARVRWSLRRVLGGPGGL
jgi:hypothetical protein